MTTSHTSGALRRTALILIASMVGIAALVLRPAEGSAQQAAPLVRANFEGQIPDALRKEILAAYAASITADKRGLKPMDSQATTTELKKVGPAMIACYTPDCLKHIGELFKTNVAVGILVGGEAQIYDFEVVFYDLSTGTPSATKRGTCEICTVSEASRAFTNVFTGTLRDAKIEPWKPAPPNAGPTKMVKPEPTVTVELVVSPSHAQIQLDGRNVGKGMASFTVKPGHYKIRASADRFNTLDIPLIVDDKTQGPIKMDLQLTAIPQTQVLVTDRTPGLLDGVHQPALGWVSIAVGAGTVVGGGFLLSLDGETTCTEGPETACPNIYDTALGGAALVGLGSALMATGTMLVLWETLAGAPIEAPKDASAQRLPFELRVDPRGGALVSFESPF